MDLLVGIAINLHGLNQINRYIVTSDAADERLSLFDNALQSIEYDWQSDLLKILDREKLMFKSFICAMFYQTNSECEVRLNRDPNSALSSQIHVDYMLSGELGSRFIPTSNYWRRKFTKAKTIFCWFFVPSTPQKTEMIIDDVHKQYYAMAESNFDWEKEPKQFSLMTVRLNFRWLVEIISRISENNWPKIHDRYLQATALKRASRLIIALRYYKNRTGRWPESLVDIKSIAPEEIFVDPFNEGPFVYKLTDDSFKLYSKGKNNIDQNGEYDYDWHQKKAEPDDWPLWPPKTRKTKEENAEDA